MKLKKVVGLIPELLLVTSIIYYWLSTYWLNPIILGLLFVIGYQIHSQKVTLGLIIASIFIFLNLYLVLALISELSEFEIIAKEFQKTLIFGSLYLGLNLFFGILLFTKHIKKYNVIYNETS